MKQLLIFLTILASCTSPQLKRHEHSLPEGKAKFCFIGDMGTASETQAMVARALGEEGCHSIHMVGDLIYPSGISSVEDPGLEKKFLAYYRPLTKVSPYPKLNLILGNHDHRGSVDAWLALGKQLDFVNFPHPYYIQNWGGLCLVHLESNYFKLLRDFFRAEEETRWLKKEADYLEQNCSTTVALTHHPFKSRGPKHGNSTGYLRSFLEENVIGKFDYLISGHEHVLSDEGKIKGTHQLISGAGGNYTDGEEVGYLVLEAIVTKGQVRKVGHTFRRFPLTK